jgi:hypothetical protein
MGVLSASVAPSCSMTASAMISPPPRSRLRRMRAGSSRKPLDTSPRRLKRSPMAMHARASAESIIRLVVRSASCSVCMASNANGTKVRTSAARAMMSWQSFGLRFCGMVELPTVPGGTGSSTSPNSVFISV